MKMTLRHQQHPIWCFLHYVFFQIFDHEFEVVFYVRLSATRSVRVGVGVWARLNFKRN